MLADVKKPCRPLCLSIVKATSSPGVLIMFVRLYGSSHPLPVNLQTKTSYPPKPGCPSDEKYRLFAESSEGNISFDFVFITFPRFSGSDHLSPDLRVRNRSNPPAEPCLSDENIIMLPSIERAGWVYTALPVQKSRGAFPALQVPVFFPGWE